MFHNQARHGHGPKGMLGSLKSLDVARSCNVDCRSGWLANASGDEGTFDGRLLAGAAAESSGVPAAGANRSIRGRSTQEQRGLRRARRSVLSQRPCYIQRAALALKESTKKCQRTRKN